MGSIQKMKRELFRRKIVMISIFLFPFMAIGLGLIGYQTYNILSGKGYQNISFNISNLWKSLNPSDGLDIFTNTDNNRSIFASLPFTNSLKVMDTKKNNPFSATYIQSRQTALFRPDLNINKNKDKTNALFNRREKLEISSISELNLARQVFFQKYLNQINKEHFLTDEIRPNRAKIFIGFSYAHLNSFRRLSYRQIQTDGITYENGRRFVFGQSEGFRNLTDRATALGGFSLDIGYQISQKWTIQSGINIRRMGERVEVLSDISEYQLDIENINKEIIGLSPEVVQQPGDIFFNNTYSFVDLPIQVQYTLKEFPRSSIRVMSHLTPRWMYGTTAMLYDFERDVYTLHTNSGNEVFNSFNISVGGGLIFTHMVSSNFDILISPFYEQNLRSTFSQEYTINQRNYTTGLNLGVRYYIPEKSSDSLIEEIL
jgi:hypothetical protein